MSSADPVTLESLSISLQSAVSILKDVQDRGLAEESKKTSLLETAKKRLAYYQQRPRYTNSKFGMNDAQPNLYKLFLAIDLAENQPVRLWGTLKYLLAMFWMTVAGLFARLDIQKVVRTLTHNTPSIGSRLRLMRGLDSYSLAVRASVGAQTVCREARQDFCKFTLKHVGAIDLDEAVKELNLPFPEHMQQTQGDGVFSPGVPCDLRFGNDQAEAREAIEQLIVSSVVSRYISRMDELVAYIGTFLVACLALFSAIIILSFPPSLLLSQLGSGSPDAACDYTIGGLAAGNSLNGACIKITPGKTLSLPIEDGTSLYKVNVYLAILAIGSPIVFVVLSGLALQIMLDMTAEVLRGVSNDTARVMYEQHPNNPASVILHAMTEHHGAIPSQIAATYEKMRLARAMEQLKLGSFSCRGSGATSTDKAAQASAGATVTTAAAAGAAATAASSTNPARKSCCSFGWLGGVRGFVEARLMPSFRKEITASRDGVLCMETEDFLDTFDMMRVDVSDASKRVGINVTSMLGLITQGLSALAVFLVVVSSMTLASGQRFVVIVLFLMAVVWVYALCGITRDTRVYAFLVLAESTKYLNMVLWIDQCLEKKHGKSVEGGNLETSKLLWPWEEEEKHNSLRKSHAEALKEKAVVAVAGGAEAGLFAMDDGIYRMEMNIDNSNATDQEKMAAAPEPATNKCLVQ